MSELRFDSLYRQNGPFQRRVSQPVTQHGTEETKHKKPTFANKSKDNYVTQ